MEDRNSLTCKRITSKQPKTVFVTGQSHPGGGLRKLKRTTNYLDVGVSRGNLLMVKKKNEGVRQEYRDAFGSGGEIRKQVFTRETPIGTELPLTGGKGTRSGDIICKVSGRKGRSGKIQGNRATSRGGKPEKKEKNHGN